MPFIPGIIPQLIIPGRNRANIWAEFRQMPPKGRAAKIVGDWEGALGSLISWHDCSAPFLNVEDETQKRGTRGRLFKPYTGSGYPRQEPGRNFTGTPPLAGGPHFQPATVVPMSADVIAVVRPASLYGVRVMVLLSIVESLKF